MGRQEVLTALVQLKAKYNIPELYLFGSFAKLQENHSRRKYACLNKKWCKE